MEKPIFKKYTKEEAIKVAKRMIDVKKEWCECVRSGRSISSLKEKGIHLVEIC